MLSLAGKTALLAVTAIPTQLVYARGSGAPPPLPFGRVLVDYRLDPSPKLGNDENGRYLTADTVIPLYEQVQGEPIGEHGNAVWFRTDGGFIHSAWLQPVDNRANAIISVQNARLGVWAETTVPFATLHSQPNAQARVAYKAYYSSVYRIVDAVFSNNAWWYKLSGGLRSPLYARAYAFRPFTPDELTPISPQVSHSYKRMEVILRGGYVRAFEQNKQVFEARCATGDRNPTRTTPIGQFRILSKHIAVQMSGAFGTRDAYDLPGVPFATFFTSSGVAFHGAYWHFDWGARRTHGCVNLSSSDARWVWRWTRPLAYPTTSGQFSSRNNLGTIVAVREK
jgi:lipoprotein-anchoring transpeptidase ErfK/SrfK